MLRYLFALSLILASSYGYSQESNAITPEQVEPDYRGLSIGINAGTFIQTLFDPSRKGFEVTGRYRFNQKWFLVAEGGMEKVDFTKSTYESKEQADLQDVDLKRKTYDYKSNGSFLRVGFDYNFFKVEEVGNNDNVMVGLRYGQSIISYESPEYTIEEWYWGNYNGALASETVTGGWAEAVFGLRSEILKNFYMGWSVRVRRILFTSDGNTLEPYSVPGYGLRDNQTNLSFTYNLEYHIPFKKLK